MYAQFYADNPLLFWPLVGLVIFVLSFVGVLIYVLFGLRDKHKVERLSRLPLDPVQQAPSPFESRDPRVSETGRRKGSVR